MSLQSERALFDACVSLSPEEREQWLNSHCDDPALRERVLKLLRVHDEAERRNALERAPAVAHLTSRSVATACSSESVRARWARCTSLSR